MKKSCIHGKAPPFGGASRRTPSVVHSFGDPPKDLVRDCAGRGLIKSERNWLFRGSSQKCLADSNLHRGTRRPAVSAGGNRIPPLWRSSLGWRHLFWCPRTGHMIK